MNTMTESEIAQERAQEVKLILRRLIDEVEVAEADAADTTWPEEKTSLIDSALNSVQSRCGNLAYDLSRSGETLLTKRERE